MVWRTRFPLFAAVMLAGALAVACDVNTALEELTEARRLTSDLHVQFTKASDASNRAVMADTDETSATFAREAGESAAQVQKDIAALGPLLETLRFSDEERLLQEFAARFSEYRELDRVILGLAVENSNLKAQRLSFGDAQQAADALREALDGVAPLDRARDEWHIRALAATALAGAREIQALQAPHIAEADDADMAAIEKRMAASEAEVRRAIEQMSPLIQPSSKPRLTAAAAALDRLMAVNAQIVDLSRRNTNVRSLALSLNQKGPLVAAADERLLALQNALAKRGYRTER